MTSVIGPLRQIFDRATKVRLVLAAIGTTCAALLDTVAIALVYPLVDLAANPDDPSNAVEFLQRLLDVDDAATLLPVLAVAVVVLFVLKDLAQLTFTWWMTGFTYRQRVQTTSQLLGHYLTSPWTAVSQRSSAEMIRTADAAVMNVFNLTVAGLLTGFTALVTILGVLTALLVVSPLPTLVLIAYFGLAALLYVWLVRPRAARAGEELTTASQAGYHAFLSALGGLKEIILRGSHRHFTDAYERASYVGAEAARRASFYAVLPRYVLEILFILAVGLILLLGRSGGLGGALATLALFVAAGLRILPSLSSLLGAVSNVRVGSPSLELVRDEVVAARRRATARPDARDTAAAMPFEDEIRVDGVSFRYPEGRSDVLSDVDLVIRRGSSVALVGGSGAGKTTLADLILGLHEPHTGRVTVDGTDISTDLPGWRRNVGQVPQDVFLLDATLAENIAFDLSPDAVDSGRVQAAVNAAQLGDVVADLPQGLGTRLGERGSRLSGGQKQRVGIARALYHDPQVLVLDEATSALDSETEQRITRTLRDLRGRVTQVTIAHRLSTVRDADQIVFLSGGRVAATGTFEQVRAASVEFARLVELGSLVPTEPLDGTTDD